MAATKVLVVDDDLNIQRVLVFTLKQEGFEVHVASDGQAGVEMAASIQPDLILMDVAMPRLDGYAATQQIRAAEQGGRRVPIIMLTAEADVEQRVKGLRAGADDDIVKPFHPLELIARIKALLARSGGGQPAKAGTEPATLGRLCCFYGAKGGVGTTTIAINTAIALASRLKRRTALFDANLQFGDMRVFMDLGLDSSSVVNAISEPDLDADLLKRLMVHHDAGIDLLLAPPNPEQADIVVERQRLDPSALSNILRLLRRSYDYTLVDMAKTIDDFNLQLFDEADVIFVVMTADLSCLKNVRLVLETMDSLGYERGKVQLVLNRSNAYTGINVDNAESALGRRIDYQVINEYRGAIGALNSGAPFMLSRPDGPLGQSVSKFAREVDSLLADEVATAGKA
ncbi:MAG TPA: response regulator [Candidatus Limnocylindria bacterium]|jgi:pilus assembly protein CpaE|nr:response regulator [Candidatus Limnocylindria bacterium]